MPALAEDIIRATRAARIVTQEDPEVLKQFPKARDGAEAPGIGFFENAEDAAAALALKAQLVGRFRRRYVVSIAGELLIDPLDGIPTVRLTDPELGLQVNALVTRVVVDMQTETTRVEVLG